MPRPSLSPLRHGEIPGIRGELTGRPNATIAIVVLSLFGFLVLAFVPNGDLALQTLSSDPLRYVTVAFAYPNGWYQLAALVAIGLFGWRLELRHGPIVVVALFLACGVGGDAIAAAVGVDDLIFGAPGAALGMLAAWAVPDLLRVRRGEETDADFLGVLVIALVVALMPLAVDGASAIATFSGGLLGLLAGLMLARTEAAR